MTAGTILKIIGSLLVVSIIALGSFLTYVVFNPDQAGFFITVFGIDPNDVANLLKQLVNVSFGVVTLVLAIVWIIALFRAIWTPKEYKRKRLLGWIGAILLGVLLFGLMTFWAYLFDLIGKTDFTNPGGNIVVYDNDLYVNNASRDIARLNSVANLVGPITLRYDISQNARQYSNKNAITINNFEINFDGANCQNGDSTISGNNPLTEQSIICTFDRVGTYNVRGSYTFQTRAGEPGRIDIPLEQVEVRWLLDITRNTNKDGKNIVTIDASKIRNLGTPRWAYSTNPNNIFESNSITELPSATPLLVCFNIFWGNNCNRTFVIQEEQTAVTDGRIEYIKNTGNTREYTFFLTGLTQNTEQILGVDWVVNGNTKICTDNTNKDICTYTFSNDGAWKIDANVRYVGDRERTISQNIRIDAPLTLDRRVKVYNRSGNELNPQSSFDVRTQAYVISGITIPETITLDARDVISNNPSYRLWDVTWKITDGDTVVTLTGDRVTYTVERTLRYNISVEYTFEKMVKTGQEDDVRTAGDTIILDLSRRNLAPVLKIQQSSDYVPAKITVDGSQSQAEYSNIITFIYDFGEGKPPAIGDAIRTYEYTTPGEKAITLTIVDSNNNRATATGYVILKDTPPNIGFRTSLSPATVGNPVDFIASDTTGQIDTYIWNFGDNTSTGRGYESTHIYTKSGSYNVTLTVRYIDGTEQSVTQKFSVVDALQ